MRLTRWVRTPFGERKHRPPSTSNSAAEHVDAARQPCCSCVTRRARSDSERSRALLGPLIGCTVTGAGTRRSRAVGRGHQRSTGPGSGRSTGLGALVEQRSRAGGSSKRVTVDTIRRALALRQRARRRGTAAARGSSSCRWRRLVNRSLSRFINAGIDGFGHSDSWGEDASRIDGSLGHVRVRPARYRAS